MSEKYASTWTPIIPLPPDVPAPPRSHPNRGEPLQRYFYLTEAGEGAGWVYEFLDSEGKKIALPCVWARNSLPPFELMWRWQQFPQPRPLYNVVDTLASAQTADGQPIPAIAFPTEREADMAREALSSVDPAPPCVSWPGGSATALRADWAPLKGRPVILWPEYTAKRKHVSKAEASAGVLPESKPLLKAKYQPGTANAAKLAEYLTVLGCDVHLVGLPEPGAEREGWGVEDVIASGISGSALMDYIRIRLAHYIPSQQGDGGKAAVVEVSTPVQACAKPEIKQADTDDWAKASARIVGGLSAPVDCRENVYLFLRHHPELKGVLWADEFARKIVMRHPAPWVKSAGFIEREWDQVDDYHLGLWLVETARLRIGGEGTIAASVKWAASESRYSPPLEFLEGLRWDGINRIDSWLEDYLGVKHSEYASVAGAMFLIGMVARIYRPGCHMRAMPILEGKQFRGKSSALRILGGKWFSDTPLDLGNGKETYLMIQGVWTYEIAELDAFNRAETTRMKAFISSPSDRFRAPYERSPKDYPRHTVFVGTTNQDEYFKDSTGNTRYWPIACDQVDEIKLEALEQAREQLLAEAVVRFKQGDQWWPTADQQARLFDPEQADREIMDPWEDIVSRWLTGRSFCTTSEVLVECMKLDPGKIDSSRSMATRIGMVMKRMGWSKQRVMRRGKRDYEYVSPERAGENGVIERVEERFDDEF